MKHILITGAESYVGTALERYLTENFPDDYTVSTVDVREDTYLTDSFYGYDTVVHVAGIVHRPTAPAELYYKVNRDLAITVAEKAKREGVAHFILFSTMSVYGKTTGVITKDTPLCPKSHYGKSRAQAEEAILAMEDGSFAVTVLRPPMIYGNGCKGNFNTVVKLVKALPSFPRVSNRRSMLYIENLNVFMRRVIDERMRGIYFPRNTVPMNTTEMARAIADALGTRLHLSRILGAAVFLTRPFIKKFRKAFGTLVYIGMGDEALYEDVIDNASSVKLSVL